VEAARGEGAKHFLGREFPSQDSLSGEALIGGQAVFVEGQSAGEMFNDGPETGPTLVIPLSTFGRWIAAVSVSRRVGDPKFTPDEADMITRFATQAAVAIEIARGRSDRQQLELAQDRTRIARDLHDHVIQRLFATGLSLQSTAGQSSEAARGPLLDQVDAIDAAISEIRAVVFALSMDHRQAGSSLRHRLLDIATELGASLASTPTLSFRGPVDLLVRDGLADDVAAVVRESLTNVVRHAQATRIEVEVTIDDDLVSVRVDDDGIGYSPKGHVGGTENLRKRAANLGGACSIRTSPNGGTRVLWSARLGSDQ
jgi:signal transduction histidine kinase